jgi:entericidin B
MMKMLVASILSIAICVSLGCNTMEGAGKDIQSGGKAVSHAAKDVKSAM